MNTDEGIRLLKEQIARIESLKGPPPYNPEYSIWRNTTQRILEQYFDASFLEMFDHAGPNEMAASRAHLMQLFLKDVEEREKLLRGFIEEASRLPAKVPVAPSTLDRLTTAVSIIGRLCKRFHLVARELRTRREGRSTLQVEDEYDAQDMLRALLRIFFDDIRTEEWTPSYAGGSSRMDFLLKNEKIVVEVKKTRKGLESKELGEQLLIDIAKYKTHPDCKSLICFVYDPEGRLGNPNGLKNDLENLTSDELKVLVYVSPS